MDPTVHVLHAAPVLVHMSTDDNVASALFPLATAALGATTLRPRQRLPSTLLHELHFLEA
jgi:hypothetical protein